MAITTLTSREFNQDSSRAKKAAEHGHVFITDRGKPAHVLLSIDNYRKLAGQDLMLAEALAQADVPDFEFAPPRAGGIIRPPDLSLRFFSTLTSFRNCADQTRQTRKW